MPTKVSPFPRERHLVEPVETTAVHRWIQSLGLKPLSILPPLRDGEREHPVLLGVLDDLKVAGVLDQIDMSLIASNPSFWDAIRRHPSETTKALDWLHGADTPCNVKAAVLTETVVWRDLAAGVSGRGALARIFKSGVTGPACVRLWLRKLGIAPQTISPPSAAAPCVLWSLDAMCAQGLLSMADLVAIARRPDFWASTIGRTKIATHQLLDCLSELGESTTLGRRGPSTIGAVLAGTNTAWLFLSGGDGLALDRVLDLLEQIGVDTRCVSEFRTVPHSNPPIIRRTLSGHTRRLVGAWGMG